MFSVIYNSRRLGPALLLLAVACSGRDCGGPDEATVRTLFADASDKYGRNLVGENSPYQIGNIERGSFSAPQRREALVCFRTRQIDMPQEQRGKALWLLRFEENWQPVRELNFIVDDGFRCYPDEASRAFRIVDLENDGRDELLITYGYQGGGGGEADEFTELWSLADDSLRVMFRCHGFDYSGLSVVEMLPPGDEDKGIASTCHRITFEDVNSDGILELIDTEEIEYWYRTPAEDTIFRWYEVDTVEVVITEHVYELHDGCLERTSSEVSKSYFK